MADYYAELTTTFGFTIDVLGPVLAKEALLDEIADSSDLAILIGGGSRSGSRAPPMSGSRNE